MESHEDVEIIQTSNEPVTEEEQPVAGESDEIKGIRDNWFDFLNCYFQLIILRSLYFFKWFL